MTKLELGMNEKGELAVLKIFADDVGYFTTDGLEGYTRLGIINAEYNKPAGVVEDKAHIEYFLSLLKSQEKEIKHVIKKLSKA